MRVSRGFNLFLACFLAASPLWLSGGGGCGASPTTESPEDGEQEDGSGGEPEVEGEPASLENLDQGFFSCTGRIGSESTCREDLFFGLDGRLQRSFFYLSEEGESLRVYDEDSSFLSPLEGDTLDFSGELASYRPIFSYAEGTRETIGYCRLEVVDVTYHLSFTSKDLFTATIQGTITDGSVAFPPCNEFLFGRYLPESCLHEVSLTCMRVQENGLTLEEIIAIQESTESRWEEQVTEGGWVSP